MRGDFYAISETDQLFGITGKRAADQNSGICEAGKSGKRGCFDGAAEWTGYPVR